MSLCQNSPTTPNVIEDHRYNNTCQVQRMTLPVHKYKRTCSVILHPSGCCGVVQRSPARQALSVLLKGSVSSRWSRSALISVVSDDCSVCFHEGRLFGLHCRHPYSPGGNQGAEGLINPPRWTRKYLWPPIWPFR